MGGDGERRSGATSSTTHVPAWWVVESDGWRCWPGWGIWGIDRLCNGCCGKPGHVPHAAGWGAAYPHSPTPIRQPMIHARHAPRIPIPAVVKCSIELGNYIHLSNYVQKAESTPEAQVKGYTGCEGM